MLKAYLNGDLNGNQLMEFEQTVRSGDRTSFLNSSIELPHPAIENRILNTVASIEKKLATQDFFFIGQLKRRERPAQKRLYRSLYPKVKKHIMNNSGAEEDAKDFTQEIIIKLYEKIRKPNTRIKTVEGFAYGILKNDWLKELDKRNRTAEKKELLRTEQSRQINHNDEDSDGEMKDCKKKILKESLDNLRNEQKAFLEYYDLNEHSIKETALHFQMDEGSVKVKANRCRNYLRKKIVKHPNFKDCFNKSPD